MIACCVFPAHKLSIITHDSKLELNASRRSVGRVVHHGGFPHVARGPAALDGGSEIPLAEEGGAADNDQGGAEVGAKVDAELEVEGHGGVGTTVGDGCREREPTKLADEAARNGGGYLGVRSAIPRDALQPVGN